MYFTVLLDIFPIEYLDYGTITFRLHLSANLSVRVTTVVICLAFWHHAY